MREYIFNPHHYLLKVVWYKTEGRTDMMERKGVRQVWHIQTYSPKQLYRHMLLRLDVQLFHRRGICHIFSMISVRVPSVFALIAVFVTTELFRVAATGNN